RRPQGSDRRRRLALLLEAQAETEVGRRVGRIYADRLAVPRGRSRPVFGARVNPRVVGMQRRVPRVSLERLAEVGNGRLGIAPIVEDGSQVVVASGVVRIYSERALVLDDCLLDVALDAERVPQGETGVGEGGL